MKNLVKLVALSAVASTLVLTGCSGKRPGNSNVVVAPIGGGMGSGYYGGPVGGSNGGAYGNIGGSSSGRPAVYFGFDSSSVSADGASVLNSHSQALKADSNARVVITGHTDERGSNEYNMALGERRAKAVQSYLAAHGVPASRTEAISNGEDQPANPGHDEGAWQQNRRAELSY